MNKNELIKLASKWLEDKLIVKEARGMIPDGLSESKLANWRRTGREYPNAFLEGIALSQSARYTRVDHLAVERACMSGKIFWQVHVVLSNADDERKHDEENTATKRHDCLVMRYWEGVKPLPGMESPHLIHKIWASGDPTGDLNPVVNLENGEKLKERGGDAEVWLTKGANKKNAPPERKVTFEIADGEHNYGYSVELPGAIDGEKRDALCGLSIVPVETAIFVAFLPRKLLPISLEHPRFGEPPTCLVSLMDGDPVSVLEDHLGHKVGADEKPELESWIWDGPSVRTWDRPLADRWDGLEAKMPDKLKNAARKAYEQTQKHGEVAYGVYVSVVHTPSPYLTYVLVFGERPQQQTDTDKSN